MNLEAVIAEELTVAYLQAGKHLDEATIIIVARSLSNAIDFENEEEVRGSFLTARDIADIPTQRVLKDALKEYRMKHAPVAPSIGYGTNEDTRPVIKDEKDYIFAWWHFHGTKASWLTDEQARKIIDDFEADPKHREFVNYQKGWTHVAQENVDRYGIVTCRTRFA